MLAQRSLYAYLWSEKLKKVLLIEDDDIIREHTAEILKLANYDVITASNGKDGGFLAKSKIPDIILCDIMMPDLDGYGVLHVVSSNPQTATIPFLFLTAKTQLTDIRKGMGLGADDYLCKPFSGVELLEAIEVRLKKMNVQNNPGLSDNENMIYENVINSNLFELLQLDGNYHTSTYKKKEIIFHEGDTPQYIYYIKSGSVKGYKTHCDGKEFTTNIYVPNDFFGYVAFFTNKTFIESTIAINTCEIIKIPKDDFLKAMSKNKEISVKFLNLLSGSLKNQEFQLMSLAYDSVRKRTADALLYLIYKSSYKGQHENEIIVSRDDLASLVGTATETVIRCLGEFKEDELISVKGRQINIKDIDGLKKV